MGCYKLLWILALGTFVLDQATKIWISSHMPLGTYGPPGAVTVIDGFFYLVHVGNTGAAWSMFTGKSVFLAALAFVTLGAIFIWRHTLGLRHRFVQIGFGQPDFEWGFVGPGPRWTWRARTRGVRS